MKQLTLALFALTLLAGGARADVTITMSRTDLTDKNPTPDTGTTWLGSDRLAAIWGTPEAAKKSGNQDTHVIYRGDQQALWLLQDDKKSYTEITKESMEKMGQQIDESMAKMQAELAKLPEAQRKMMEKSMGSMMGMGQAAAPKREVKKTGETKTINGFPCTKYQVNLDGKLNSEVWATPMDKFGITKGDLQVFADMAKMFESITSHFKQAVQANGVMNPDGIDGMPVSTTTFDAEGKPTSVVEYQSVKKGAIDAARFEVPKDYKKKEMMGGK